MPGIKTEISEIVTGLGALGHDVEAALRDPPSEVVNVPDAVWDRLHGAHGSGEHAQLFAASWLNGRAFLLAADGLRGRIPRRVEWKGPDKPVGSDPVPADLRIDHVFLVSVKQRSRVLWNTSPANVFDQGLAARAARPGNWYAAVAPDEYRELYGAVRTFFSLHQLPADVARIGSGGRQLAELLKGPWPAELESRYRALAQRVSTESARRWNAVLTSPDLREQQLWRLIRLAPAPYYLLGATATDALRVRIATPWDWRQEWSFADLSIASDLAAGQPLVAWNALARSRSTGELREVAGVVEVRWAHGRFASFPEAKIQLTTRHEDVPGYTTLA